MKRYILTTVVILVIILAITLYPKQSVDQTYNIAANRQVPAGLDIGTTENKVKPTFIAQHLRSRPIPTNRIWSSIVTTGQMEGLYLFPFATKNVDGSLIVGKPTPRADGKVVTAQVTNDMLKLSADTSIATVLVADYSDLSLQLEFKDAEDRTLFVGTFIQGSPYIFITPQVSTLTISETGLYKLTSEENAIFSANDHHIALFSNGKKSSVENGVELNFSEIDTPYLTLGIMKSEADYEVLSNYAQNSISSVTAEPTVAQDTVTTTYRFKFTDQAPEPKTIWGLLPHQYHWQDIGEPIMEELTTLRGPLRLAQIESEIAVGIPRLPLVSQLMLPDTANKESLVSVLRSDTTNLSVGHTGSYFAGKEVAKYASLLLIARELGDETTEQALTAHIRDILTNWLSYSKKETGRYFTYDTDFGGLVAQIPEFDSESFNDHHFHYGYYLYAASVLAEVDENFRNNANLFVDYIAKDIANVDRNSSFSPYLRHFDFYENHSWATGFKTNNDGNNQESTSEAIHAWYALWRWGVVTQNPELQQIGTYLYSQEVNAAEFYWLNRYPQYEIFPAAYSESTASLVWGGKFEYSTFFSADPLAINGIQYLPFTSGSLYLFDAEYTQRDFDNTLSFLQESPASWLDINVMYYITNNDLDASGLLDADAKDIKIDDGNSRSNLIYWQNFWSDLANISPFFGDDKVQGYKLEGTNSAVDYLLFCESVGKTVRTNDINTRCE